VHSRNKTIRKFAVELLTARTPETPDLKPALDSALTFHDSGFSVSVAKISTAKRAGRDGTGSFNEKAVVLAHKRIVCYTKHGFYQGSECTLCERVLWAFPFLY